jgi:hypothetical protein
LSQFLLKTMLLFWRKEEKILARHFELSNRYLPVWSPRMLTCLPWLTIITKLYVNSVQFEQPSGGVTHLRIVYLQLFFLQPPPLVTPYFLYPLPHSLVFYHLSFSYDARLIYNY